MERKKVKADLEEGVSNSADPQIEDVLRLGLATGEGVLPGTSSPNSAGGATATIGFFSTFESHKSLKVETFFAVTMRGRKHETGLTRDYSDHPLVLGPGFQPNDFDLQVSLSLYMKRQFLFPSN